MLEGFQPKEGAILLSQIAPQSSVSNLSRQVAEELGGLPQAICQMASYIRQTRCTLDQFLQNLRTRSRKLYSDTISTEGMSYPITLAACFDISMSRLSEEETHLLGVIAFFQTDEVHEALITKGCLNVPRLKHLDDFFVMNNTIRMLAKHGLVTRYGGNSGQSLRVHRVVKRHALHAMDAKDPYLWHRAFHDAIDLINHVFPSRPSNGGTMCRLWAECEVWLPHLVSLHREFMTHETRVENIPRAYVELLCNCSYYMWERQTRNALEFSIHALDVCDKVLEDDEADPLRADILTTVAALKLLNFHSREECAKLFQRALDVRQRYMVMTPDPTHDDRLQLANAYNNTGGGYLVLEDYNRALPLFRRALDIKRTLGNEDNMPYDMGLSFYNICRVQMGTGLYQEAKINARKAVELVESSNGPEDFRSNQFRFTYANLLVACGEVEKGLEVHERTLEIRSRVMGKESNDTAVSYYGLSCVYQKLGRLEDALYTFPRTQLDSYTLTRGMQVEGK